jgi:signal peptidase II
LALRTSRTFKAALVAFLLLSTVACDQASKSWARRSLNHSSVQAFGGHLQLILTENRGVFLSLGSHINAELRAILFTGGVALALVWGVGWLFARDHTVARAVSVSLIIGGGFGNVMDRVSRSGAVTDFIFVWYGPLRTGIFNLADAFITTGVVSLLLAGAFQSARTPKPT